MARPAADKPRVFGPYAHGRKWRIFVVSPDGTRAFRDIDGEEEAYRVVRSLKREAGYYEDATVAKAIDKYELFLRDEKGNKLVSVRETIRRMRRFFVEPDIDLRLLSPERCARYYERLIATPGKHGKPLSADSHRNMLLEARSFLRWCASKRLIGTNPLEHVKGKGRRRKGKPQLRIDETRAWAAKALELAKKGDDGALGALLALYLGPRASEITRRKARDLDDACRLLVIEDTKTEAGNRVVEVPAVLKPLLKKLVKGRHADDWLFPAPKSDTGHHWRDWPSENIRRICDLAGVPRVSAHGLRGTHSSLAMQAGATGHLVAAALGHEDAKTTAAHYLAPGTAEKARQQRAMKVIDGGKRKIGNSTGN